MFNNFYSENRAFYEIMWKNTEVPDRPQIKIWRMRIACLITKSTDTHSEYVNTYCFLTATMVPRKSLTVTFKRTIVPVLYAY